MPHSSAHIFLRHRQSLSQRYKDTTSDLCTRKVSRVHDTLFAAFPVELRVEIFRHFCGSYSPVATDKDGPLLLLRVCRAWKDLVLHTPQLWTSFSLDFQRSLPGPKEGEFIIRVLKQWIERSRNLSLSFQLRYPVLDTVCTDLIETILSVSSRWRDATLYVPSTSLLSLWEATPDRFPSLRSLSVETTGPSPFLLRDLGINWAQLIELDLFLITIPTLDECLHVLKEGINLVRCSINAICVLSAMNDLERLALPKLEHLQLKLYGSDHGGLLGAPEDRLLAFLETLSLPGLESLSIVWGVSHGPQHAACWSVPHSEKFAAFLGHLGKHLRTLDLAYIPFTTPHALRCLEAVPALQELGITLSGADSAHDFINDDFLSAITLQPDPKRAAALVPLLQTIRLDSRGESFSNPVLLRFIASRWKYPADPAAAPGRLERIELLSPKRRTEYLPRHIKDLKEGRLDVHAELKCESSMLDVLGAYLDTDSYKKICFMNCDFPSDIRSLLVFSSSSR